MSTLILYGLPTLWSSEIKSSEIIIIRQLISLIKGTKNRLYLEIEIRAYDEGIAFRYLFSVRKIGGPYLYITKDLTEFTFPEKTKAWFTPRAQTKYKLLPLEKWYTNSERPLTLILPNGTICSLTEADQWISQEQN